MKLGKNFFKKFSFGLVELFFWWIFSFIKVCKKQARFEALNSIFVAVFFLTCYLFYRGRLDLNNFILIYFTMGLILTLKNLWMDFREKEIVSC